MAMLLNDWQLVSSSLFEIARVFVRLDDVAASRERLKNLATIAAKRQRVSIRSHDRVSNRVLPDATTMRQPDCVFQSKSFFHADLI